MPAPTARVGCRSNKACD